MKRDYVWSPKKMGERYNGKNLRLISMDVEDPEKVLFSMQDAAEYLGVSRQTVYYFLNQDLFSLVPVKARTNFTNLREIDRMIVEKLIPRYNSIKEKKGGKACEKKTGLNVSPKKKDEAA